MSTHRQTIHAGRVLLDVQDRTIYAYATTGSIRILAWAVRYRRGWYTATEEVGLQRTFVRKTQAVAWVKAKALKEMRDDVRVHRVQE